MREKELGVYCRIAVVAGCIWNVLARTKQETDHRREVAISICRQISGTLISIGILGLAEFKRKTRFLDIATVAVLVGGVGSRFTPVIGVINLILTILKTNEQGYVSLNAPNSIMPQRPAAQETRSHVIPRLIKNVFIVKKWQSAKTLAISITIAEWYRNANVTVFVENPIEFPSRLNVRAFSQTSQNHLDLVVTVGGDGTLLHVSRLLGSDTEELPPCVVFSMGSLGFLANFSTAKWRETLTQVPCMEPTYRTRLQCTTNSTDKKYYVLNEVAIIGRGTVIAQLEIWINGYFVTLCEGDGLIVSTATGSTGYNMSCGGPVAPPSVPCIMVSPIAPASLSFRPLVLNEHARLTVTRPLRGRPLTIDVQTDGRSFASLAPGQSVDIVRSPQPLPVLTTTQNDKDWLESITTKLKWNARGAVQSDD
eukprot:TRINITY_DN4814_c1_g1_i2.p1 TRINITY_DN4814_c1_g1~~TRINITY_DN4814_c1_g1_i2.p1  ORF type:complete len:439 (+),score=28.28 TRINITY_DN4814_c1_g1_i2:51-1319(+)